MTAGAEPTSPSAAELERRLERCRIACEALGRHLEAVHLGDPALVEHLLAALLADGHVLLEGAPGLGKTRLLKALAGALDLEFRRVQGTPDLLPGDLTGSELLEEDDGRRSFRFEPGPVFTQVLLFDEINRATPRTQSALLEAMEERQVSVGLQAHVLPEPFFVVATQNPIELEGTYPLPEAQLDRFLFLLRVEVPDEEVVAALLRGEARDPETLEAPLLDADGLAEARRLAADLPVAEPLLETLARLTLASHPHSETAPPEVVESVAWGVSPRGAQAALRGARGLALVRGRAHVAPEDLADATRAAFRHRLVLDYEARSSGRDGDAIVSALLRRFPLH